MKFVPDCDLLIGNKPENDSDSQYYECEFCHRYEICKKYYKLKGIDRMSDIKEQIDELRYKADIFNVVGSAWELNRAEAERLQSMLRKSANTIEALSKAANGERTEIHCGDNAITEIVSGLDRRIGVQLKLMAGTNDETLQYGYGKALEAYQQSKILIEITAAEYKEKQTEDGWIYCGDGKNLPEEYQNVLASGENVVKQAQFIKGVFECEDPDIYGMVSGEKMIEEEDTTFKVIAWKPMPFTYHEP